MTLKEVINERIGEFAKIGSGNSFIWCGQITDDLPAVMDRLSIDELAKLQDRLKKLNSHMSRFEHIWSLKLESRMRDFNRNVREKKWSMDLIHEKHKKVLAKFEAEKAADRRATEKGIYQLTKAINEFTPFTKRKVKEIYPSLEKGNIIIFKGSENGRYWLYEEAENEIQK